MGPHAYREAHYFDTLRRKGYAIHADSHRKD
jgi:DNA-binding winged helix-turn-helix (wHTH) protein